jgi:hypothetical protein
MLDNTTVNGVMDMATVDNSRQRVVNGLTLNGTVNINNNGILSFEGTQALGGSGSVVLGSTGAGNRIDAGRQRHHHHRLRRHGARPQRQHRRGSSISAAPRPW